jgi:hypothetical protein|tara:strand:+ start:4622 stop:4726 length:105 start_codon:yes stop_codon:yes gene_type:complete
MIWMQSELISTDQLFSRNKIEKLIYIEVKNNVEK